MSSVGGINGSMMNSTRVRWTSFKHLRDTSGEAQAGSNSDDLNARLKLLLEQLANNLAIGDTMNQQQTSQRIIICNKFQQVRLNWTHHLKR